MGLFVECSGDVAVIHSKGVYKQVPLYIRNGFFYAKANGGFIKLNSDGSTSHPGVRLETITVENIPTLATDAMGRLCDNGIVPGSKLLAEDKKQKLLGVEA
jgi:hypothetical protein